MWLNRTANVANFLPHNRNRICPAGYRLYKNLPGTFILFHAKLCKDE